MINNLMYIELKTGYSDDGPAWIGYVKTSKSKKTIYYNDHAFQKNIGNYAISLNITVSHVFVDGYHLSKVFNNVQELLNDTTNVLK